MGLIDKTGVIIAIITMVFSTLFSWNRSYEFGQSLLFGILTAACVWLVYIVMRIKS